MARAATLGNGSLLVGLDGLGQVRDLYFPHVGHANHVSGASGSYVHRLGVSVNGEMSWLSDPGWDVTMSVDAHTTLGVLSAEHKELGVTITSTDAVHNEHNVFLRSFVVTNVGVDAAEVTFFMAQQFRINESRRGDTGFYDPRSGSIIHYKGHHKFLINAVCNGTQFTEYNIGLFGIEGKEGTFKDAEDGRLEKNPIEHGSVDSIIGVSATLAPQEHAVIEYWIVAGKTIDEVHDLNQLIVDEEPSRLILSTGKYWEAWQEQTKTDLSMFSKQLQRLYYRSLTTIRAHSDNGGGIIASSDTDMLHHGRDTYSYVWPRDAAIVAHSLDKTGHTETARKYFLFMTKRLERDGYLYHKYRVDGVLGSSWHPWLLDGQVILPIQEDETALTLIMLWRHYQATEDVEFLEQMYNSFIEPVGNFLVSYIEARLGLPEPSFDLWEEKYGISTYTASTVTAALDAAACAAQLLGKDEAVRTYSAVADRMRHSIMEHLYDDELGMFVKLVRYDSDDELQVDRVVDMSSFFGPLYFGVVDVHDERVQRAFTTIEERLRVNAASEGYVRYEGDNYYRLQAADSPNPWVITTLWMAQYHIMKAQTVEELTPAYELLEWTCSHATRAGVLAEQMHPHTREHLSTSPLVWSHAEFVLSVIAYKEKFEALQVATEE